MNPSVLEAASRCSNHPIGITAEEITQVIASRQWCNCESRGHPPCGSWCDHYGAAIYQLSSGQYSVVTEWSDTTGHGGHGCRCGGDAKQFTTLENAKDLGLTATERKMLGV